MRILVFKHFSIDDESVLLTWAEERRCAVALFEPPSGAPFPPLEPFDMLIALGGPMSAYQEREMPWLAEEKAYIRRAVEQGKFVLGICLGAQLMADALGGRVFRNAEKEIGWHEVTRTGEAHPLAEGLPGAFCSFHWHGDAFELPPGAVRLAYSAACRNQAFAFGERALALQFHLETTPAAIGAWTTDWAEQLTPAPYVQTADAMLGQTSRCAASAGYLRTVLDNFRGLHAAGASASAPGA